MTKHTTAFALGQTGDREDSLRRRLAEVLARQTDGLLLLTATPHDGYDPHFASLLELLDPSLVTGNGTLRGDAYRRHVVRRLKRHISPYRVGVHKMVKRSQTKLIRLAHLVHRAAEMGPLLVVSDGFRAYRAASLK